eukprot:PRCOL_00001666-RA
MIAAARIARIAASYGAPKGVRAPRSFRRVMASCAASDTAEGGERLLEKRCIPCEGKDIEALTEAEAEKLMPQVPLWALEEVDGQAGILSLHRRYKTKNFVKALELMQRIGAVAEEEGHHPDLHLTGWNNLEVSIFTHAIGGLSENDFILAAKIETVDTEDLLRKKKKSLS